MGRGRPKGSKNKPKERTRNAQERSAHMAVGSENEESKSDHDIDSDSPTIMEETRQTESEINGQEEEIAENNNGNGNEIDQHPPGAEEIMDEENDFHFEEDDEYGKLFSKLALLPQLDMWMNSHRWKACKKAIGNLCNEYLREQSEKNLFNILSFWKLVKIEEKTKILRTT